MGRNNATTLRGKYFNKVLTRKMIMMCLSWSRARWICHTGSWLMVWHPTPALTWIPSPTQPPTHTHTPHTFIWASKAFFIFTLSSVTPAICWVCVVLVVVTVTFTKPSSGGCCFLMLSSSMGRNSTLRAPEKLCIFSQKNKPAKKNKRKTKLK